MTGCTSCGACCRFIVLQVNPQYEESPDVKRWIELHGIKLIRKEQGVWAYIPTPCSALNENRCGIYEDRPNVCRTWPTSQADIDELHDFLGEKVCTVTGVEQ